MKKILFFFFSLVIGIVLLFGVVKFVGWGEISSAFRIFASWQGMVIIVLTGLMLFFGMWKWKVILKDQGYDISNKKLTFPYLAGFSLIYLFPMVVMGGEIFRSYVIKEKFGVPWKQGIISVAIDKILEGTAFLIAILAGIIYFFFEIGLPPKNLAILLGSVVLVLVLGTGFFYLRSFRKKSIASVFLGKISRNKFINGEILEIEKEIFKFFKLTGSAFWQGLVLAFLRVGITWFRCWILIVFLGKTIGFLPALSILGFYYIALFIPIPTALGTHEIIQVFSFTALEIGANIAPSFTMIQRGSEVILAILGLVIFLRLGIGLLQTLLFKKFENLIDKYSNNH
jgi:uncharacterized protein (TIRG00374 family)